MAESRTISVTPALAPRYWSAGVASWLTTAAGQLRSSSQPYCCAVSPASTGTGTAPARQAACSPTR